MGKTFIIAEAGINHNGSVKAASKLIVSAKKCGADAIKFQSFVTEENITRNAPKAAYQLKNSPSNETQFEMVKKLEFNEKDHHFLIKKCLENNIEFMSSPFDIKSIKLLKKLSVKRFKIPSGEIINLPYLRCMGKINKPIILSTGMSTLSEIKIAVGILEKAGTKRHKISILHCNTEYPTPLKDVNLNAMLTIKNTLNINVGYSDHTLSMETPIVAVAMGAKIIEKHFTLNRSLPGPDQKTSFEPKEFKLMVESIRKTESILGSEKKMISQSEFKNKAIARKSIVAKSKIKKGETLNENNLAIKRPGTGISPMKWDSIVNSKAKKNYLPDEMI